MVDNAKVLSVFDGMACGMLAMQSAGIKIDRYVAFEIDKYAVETSSHNFPSIEHRGDVFKADFTEFRGFDFLVGGSPCTYWSIAQKNNRETEASGMGWELFSQYVRALREAQPMYFIYENNKSMSKAIRKSITETFGFDAFEINSALVSAQNRQRLYWVGRRNTDGTYSQVHVEQPEDRGILLRDVLDGMTDQNKGRCVLSSIGRTTTREYFQKCQGTMAYEPVASVVLNVNPSGKGINGAVGRIDAKSRCLTTNKGEGQKIIVPCAEPVRIPEYGDEDKARPLGSMYSNNCGGFEHRMFNDNPHKQQVDMVAQPIYIGEMPGHGGEYRNGKQPSQQYRVYSADGKSVSICENGGGMGAITGLYAIPIEFDGNGPIKAVSLADGQVHTVYQVKDGYITIKGKQYPIKLADGFYIIRKLTVNECKRLQTVPEWYEFPVSNSQAYKMLGNGWTVEVIAHLIRATQTDIPTWEQMQIIEQ